MDHYLPRKDYWDGKYIFYSTIEQIDFIDLFLTANFKYGVRFFFYFIDINLRFPLLIIMIFNINTVVMFQLSCIEINFTFRMVEIVNTVPYLFKSAESSSEHDLFFKSQDISQSTTLKFLMA